MHPGWEWFYVVKYAVIMTLAVFVLSHLLNIGGKNLLFTNRWWVDAIDFMLRIDGGWSHELSYNHWRVGASTPTEI